MQNTPNPDTYNLTGIKAVNVGTDVSKVFTFPYSLTGSTMECQILTKDLATVVMDWTCTVDIGDSKILLVTCERGTLASAIGTEYGDYVIRLYQTDTSDDKFIIFSGIVNFYK